MNKLKKSIVVLFLCSLFIPISGYTQEKNNLEAVRIAKEHYNSIVKIFVFDSISEKHSKGSGYLGRGSGFIVSEDGLIFTNRHVIEYGMGLMQYDYFSPSDNKVYSEVSTYEKSNFSDPEYLKIHYIRKANLIVQIFNDYNGRAYTLYNAKLLALDSINFDGAILQIVSKFDGTPIVEKFNPVKIGNSDESNQGEDLCLFGFPSQYDDAGFDLMLRDQSTLTFGKHSGFDYVFNPYYGYIKTDASVNAGNSGCPVFNSSNKAIGIATATGTTTNIGLVGGINAMYFVAATKPEILEILVKNGLESPVQVPLNNTAIINSNQSIPNDFEIKKSNEIKKTERNFLGGKDYFRLSYTLGSNHQFLTNEIGDTIGNSLINNNQKKSLEIKTTSAIGFEYGHLFTLARSGNKRKLSIDWSVGVGRSIQDWSQANLYRDQNGSTITYRDNVGRLEFNQKIGFNFSYLLKQKFPLDIYYKIAGCFIDGGQIGVFENNVYIFNNTYNEEISYTGVSFFHNLGFVFRYKIYFVGLEYNWGNSKLEFELPYVDSYPFYDGYTDGTRYDYNYSKVTIPYHFSAFKVTTGVMFGGQNKWKKLEIKKYKASL